MVQPTGGKVAGPMAFDSFGIVSKVVARTYQVEDVVAEGGFGVVYRAYHKGFRAHVALKCLKIPDELNEVQRSQFLEQFRSEAEVLFRLSTHIPAIVRPLHVDAFRTKDGLLVPFMALEWLEGRTLDSVIARRTEKGKAPLPLQKIAVLLTPVANALEQAHHFNGPNGMMTVVHRDMKPENLFIARISGEDVAKVLDFGISKVKSAASQLAGRASLTADSLAAFSPAYAAPEQWSPSTFGQTGKWTDVWGLALTVVEAAAGREVISGEPAQMMGAILDPERRPTPRSLGLTVTDQVESVFARALALDPTGRTQSIGHFWDELTAALGVQSVTGTVSYVPSAAAAPRQRVMTGGLESDWPPTGQPGAVGHGPPRSPAIEGPAVAALLPNRAAPLPLAAGPLPIVGRPQGPNPLEAAQRPTLASEHSGMMVVRSVGRPAGRPIQKSLPATPPLAAGPGGRELLGPALGMMALSLALTVLDRTYAVTRGVPLQLGPLKLSWLAGGLMVWGLINAIRAVARMSGR